MDLSQPNPLRATQIPLDSLKADARNVMGDISEAWVYSLPLNVQFRGVTERQGLLLRGPAGWGEAAPFAEYAAPEACEWLAAAIRSAHVDPPQPRRSSVTVNVTIPVVSPDEAALRVLNSGGCATAKLKVADPRSSLADDCARVEAVADALLQTVGSDARIRVDVNGAWDVDTAVKAIGELDRAAALIGGLEYVEQPCATVEELAKVRRLTNVRIAADESIRRSDDPLRVARYQAADVAVIKVAPLGGVRSALRIAEETGLDVVVSSAVETSVGIGMGIAAAAALDQTPFASGLATVQLLSGDVTENSLVPTNGHVECRAVSPDQIYFAPAVSSEVCAAWTHRLHEMLDAIVSSWF